MSVDDSLYEAAELDGANRFQFKYIILPSIKTIVTLNIIFYYRFFGAFEAPFVITGGNNGTGTFFVVMNKVAHTDEGRSCVGHGSFLLVIIFICTLLQKGLFKFLFGTRRQMTSSAAKKAHKLAAKAAVKEKGLQQKEGNDNGGKSTGTVK